MVVECPDERMVCVSFRILLFAWFIPFKICSNPPSDLVLGSFRVYPLNAHVGSGVVEQTYFALFNLAWSVGKGK